MPDWTSLLTEEERIIERSARLDTVSVMYGADDVMPLLRSLAALRALVEEKDKALHAICDKAVLTGRYGGEGYWWEIEKNGSDDLVNAAAALALSEEEQEEK